MTKNKIRFIAIGSKGTAGVIGELPDSVQLDKPVIVRWASPNEYGQTAKGICALHAQGKSAGVSFTCYDIGCFVSERGDSFKIHDLSLALKTKLVKAHKVNVNRDGKVFAVTVYAPAKWTPSNKQLRVMACDGVPALRIENAKVSGDGRNVGLIAYIVTPKASKAPAKAKAKAKTAKPVSK